MSYKFSNVNFVYKCILHANYIYLFSISFNAVRHVTQIRIHYVFRSHILIKVHIQHVQVKILERT